MNVHALRNAALVASLTLAAAISSPASAVNGPLPISQDPLYLTGPVPPMNMLVMGRDHKMYYEAYNDASDLTGDGQPDIGYKPAEIDYYGYFDSFKCYTYGSNRFTPASTTANKRCGGTAWSGDFLNYVTTSRMDALRKVLYGGKRSTDSATATELERSYVPQDAHSWGKEYQSIARDGYDIRQYTTLGLPNAGTYHLFANTSLRGTPDQPLMRVLPNTARRVWEWVSIEQPVAGDQCVSGSSRVACTASRADYVVRVRVCVPGLLEPNCQAYPDGISKPVGLLQRYGEDNQMLFGLISGSYTNNTQGGVLRRNVGRLSSEIIPTTGQFSTFQGIIRTIDAMRIVDFQNGAFQYQGGWLANAAMTPNNFPDWGNPIGEMMYESLRYFAGKENPTPAYVNNISVGATENVTVRNPSRTMALPAPTWRDPYDRDGGQPWCSKPAQLVISDVNPSYDSDSIQGSGFNSFTGDLAGFSASTEANAVWAAEHGGSSAHFIGSAGGVEDSTPTPKVISGFGSVRGLSPAEPTRQGTYYSAAAARFGQRSDLRTDLRGTQNPQTYAVALSSPLPEIKFPIGNRQITLVPFAKSPSGTFGGTINAAVGQFQPTNQIVDFYIERWANTHASNMDLTVNGGRPYASFRVNYEDVEQGADHDMDMIVRYTLAVTAVDTLQVDLVSEYAAGGIEQHAGYAVSGTTQDGVYMEVRDCDTATSGTGVPNDLTRNAAVAATCTGNGPAYNAGANANLGRRGTAYYLDTPNWGANRPNGVTGVVNAPVQPGECLLPAAVRPAQCNWGLPLSSSRTFLPSSTPAATLLRDPLWYAAKFGSDANADLASGVTPPNYYLVTNAAELETQLSELFNQILQLSQFSGGIASNGARIDAGSMAYIPEFDTRDWTGDLAAYRISRTGNISTEPEWRASAGLATAGPAARNIVTQRLDSLSPPTFEKIAFQVGSGGFASAAEAQADLGISGAEVATYGSVANIVNYLRGDASREIRNGVGNMRNRSRLMGDVLGSQPAVMGREDYGWSVLPGAEGEAYRDFLEDKRTRQPVVFVGANDGMLHAFSGGFAADGGGSELFAYVPWGVHSNLKRLVDPDYFHRYFVDGSPRLGDAQLGGQWKSILMGSTGAGGRSVFALDVTDPTSFDVDNILWEFTHLHDEDLGATIGQPHVVRLTSGRWVAVFSNGYNSTNHRAALFVVDLATGELLRKFLVGGGSESDPNGLASPVLLGMEPGSVGSDTAYAGDLHGNVWRFDLKGEPSEWEVGVGGLPLFSAVDADGARQPITGGLDVIAHPDSGSIVFFGTGQYFLIGDNVVDNDPQVQSFYAIWDDNLNVAGRDDLLEQTIESESGGLRTMSDNTLSWSLHKGWFVDLQVEGQDALGERFISRPQVRLGKVFFPTFRPTGDQCSPGGENVLMVLNASSGRPGITAPTGSCTANCGGVELPPGPPSAPPPVIIAPPNDGDCRPGIDPDCEPPCDPETDSDCTPTCDPATDPTCPCPPSNPDCRDEPPANVCGNFIIPIPGQPPLVFARPCGRQSWRQLR